ncbi:MAG: alanine racemase [Gemmatimonadaceae bacterium]|nr:alanine racemase [Gemmatimonadaceae bacterium]
MFSHLETPVPLVDLDRVERNLDRAATYARSHGLALRPHVKTHKSARIAAMQVERGADGLTCATPREAEVMQAVSGDLLVAYPPVDPHRADRLAALAAGRVTVALDSLHAVDTMARAAAGAGRTVHVYVEMDLGMRRVGVASAADAVAIARRAADAPALEFAGLAFYPGHIRQGVGDQDAALAVVAGEVERAVEAFTAAGLRPPVVSGGSTPTIWRSHEMGPVTEIRPGTYVYNDRTTAVIGACSWEECAFTVLATVVSTAVPGQAVIDAGVKSIGREPVRGAPGEGFGALLDRPEVTVRAMSEEHGILDLSHTSWIPRVGERVRVVPNHVCVAVHLFDEMIGIRDGEEVERWTVAARGRSPAGGS